MKVFTMRSIMTLALCLLVSHAYADKQEKKEHRKKYGATSTKDCGKGALRKADGHQESFAGIYNIEYNNGFTYWGVLTLAEGGTGQLFFAASDPNEKLIPEAYYWRQIGKHAIELTAVAVFCTGSDCSRSTGRVQIVFDRCNQSGTGSGSFTAYALEDLKLQNPIAGPFTATLKAEKINP